MTKADLHTFDFSGLELRVIVQMGEPWFLGRDVAAFLAIENASNAYARLGKDEQTNIRRAEVGLAPGRDVVAISESGLYKLIMRSDKPEARKFQDWVTREVLPSIRKTGGYLLNEQARDTAHASDRQAMPLPEEFAHRDPRSRPL